MNEKDQKILKEEELFPYLKPKYFVRQGPELLEFDSAEEAAIMERAANRSLINCGFYVTGGGFNPRRTGEERGIYGEHLT